MEPALLLFFFFVVFFLFDLGHTCGVSIYAVFTLKLSIDTVSRASTCRFYFVLRRLVGQVFTFGLNVKAMHHYLRSNSFRSHNDCLLIECITCKRTSCHVQQRRLKSACAFAQSDQKSCLLAFMRNLHIEYKIEYFGQAVQVHRLIRIFASRADLGVNFHAARFVFLAPQKHTCHRCKMREETCNIRSM